MSHTHTSRQKVKPYRILVWVLFFLALSGFSQQNKIDSLVNSAKICKVDSSLANIYGTIAYLEKDIELPKMRIYALKSLELATKIKHYRIQAEACNHLGIYYDYMDNDDSALYYFDKGLQLVPKANNKLVHGNLLHNKANLYNFNGEYDEALALYLQALKIREEIGREKEISSSYTNIGSVYLSLKRYKEAKAYFNKAIRIDIKRQDKSGWSICLNNLGNIYKYMNQLDSSLYCYENALKLKQETKDERGIANVYINIGGLYTDKKEYKKAIEYGLLALNKCVELKNKQGISYAAANLGAAYSHIGDHQAAINYLEQALKISLETGNNELNSELYELFAETYSKNNEFEKAYEYHKKFSALKDSILNVESSQQINEMSTKYQTEKKDKELIKKDAEIKVQEADAKQKSFQRNGFIIGFLVMILLSLFIFRGYRQKQKAHRIITLQKEKVESQKAIIEEKNKEIVDSINYAQLIQQAVLPRQEEFDRALANSFVLFKPKDIVSGDFYWLSSFDGHTFFTTVDCTGHGVPGGFMSMLGISLLNEVVNEKKIVEPADVLDMMRIKLITSLKQKGNSGENKDGMDMTLCRLSEARTELVYAAANNPLWLVRDGKLIDYPADKQPVGISTEHAKQFSQQTIPLQKGDHIYIFTDGYADQFGGPKGKKFKYKPLQELLIANANKSMLEQKEILKKSIEDWKGSLEQVDDILIIGICI